MKETQSLVSVILPVCNCGKFLSRCLETLLTQSYKNIEIIAIDDNSSDNSLKILRSFKKHDNRLLVYKNKKRYGLAITLNRAVRKIKGQYLAFMDPHDIASVQRIKKQVRFLMQNQKIVAVGSQCSYVDHKNKRIGVSNFPNDHNAICKLLVSGSSMQFETVMINRQLTPKDLLRFKTNLYPFVFSDLLLQLSTYGQLANMTQRLYIHRAMEKYHFVYPNKLKKAFSSLSLWIKSTADYDYRPSFWSLISPVR